MGRVREARPVLDLPSELFVPSDRLDAMIAEQEAGHCYYGDSMSQPPKRRKLAEPSFLLYTTQQFLEHTASAATQQRLYANVLCAAELAAAPRLGPRSFHLSAAAAALAAQQPAPASRSSSLGLGPGRLPSAALAAALQQATGSSLNLSLTSPRPLMSPSPQERLLQMEDEVILTTRLMGLDWARIVRAFLPGWTAEGVAKRFAVLMEEKAAQHPQQQAAQQQAVAAAQAQAAAEAQAQQQVLQLLQGERLREQAERERERLEQLALLQRQQQEVAATEQLALALAQQQAPAGAEQLALQQQAAAAQQAQQEAAAAAAQGAEAQQAGAEEEASPPTAVAASLEQSSPNSAQQPPSPMEASPAAAQRSGPESRPASPAGAAAEASPTAAAEAVRKSHSPALTTTAAAPAAAAGAAAPGTGALRAHSKSPSPSPSQPLATPASVAAAAAPSRLPSLDASRAHAAAALATSAAAPVASAAQSGGSGGTSLGGEAAVGSEGGTAGAQQPPPKVEVDHLSTDPENGELRVCMRRTMAQPPRRTTVLAAHGLASLEGVRFFEEACVVDRDKDQNVYIFSLRDPSHCVRLNEGTGPDGKPKLSYSQVHALYQLPDGTAWLEHTRLVDAAGLAELAQREGLSPRELSLLSGGPSPQELLRLTTRVHSRLQNVVGECWVYHEALPPALPPGAAGAAFWWRRKLDPGALRVQQQE